MASPQSVCKINYTTSAKAKENNFKFIGKIYYIGRLKEDGYVSRVTSRKNHKEIFNDVEDLKNRTLFFENSRPIKLEEKTKIKKMNKEINEIQENGGVLYSGVLSFSDDVLKNNIKGIYSEEELMEIIHPHIDKLLEKNNFPKEDSKIYSTFHSDGNHFHLHFEFLRKENSGGDGKSLLIDNKSINQLKKNVIFDINKELKKEYENLLKKQNEINKKVLKQLKENYFGKEDQELLNKYLSLQEKLEKYPKDNNVYKRLTFKTLKKEDQRILKEIIEDLKESKLKEDVISFNETNDKIKKINDSIVGKRKDNLNFIDYKEDELDKKLYNTLLKELKNERKFEGQKLPFIKTHKNQPNIGLLKKAIKEQQFELQKRINEYDRLMGAQLN